MVKLLLKQKIKELYNAEFEILKNNNVVGNVFFDGNIGSMETRITGTFYEKNFSLEFTNKILKGSNKKFRPYNIIENDSVTGEIYQTEFKKNIFSKYNYVKCIYENSEYNSYNIGLGNKGVNCIYINDTQVSQIEKDGTVYNDLHNFEVYIKDNKYSLISIIFACYTYVNTCFKPGIKVTKSIVKNYNKTTNKELKSKYNQDWINEIK